jgi:carbonic anhydrase
MFLLATGCAPSNDADPTPTQTPELVSDVLTSEAQQALTPEEVLEDLKEGNRRFTEGRLTPRDYMAQAAATASGQYPKAVVLGCVDSRVPPEILFDQGIGDIFVGRVAGNFENTDLLGSLEFATKVAGSKLIVVLGHTSCGAIKGAIAGVDLGNLTAMLDNIDEVLEKVKVVTSGSFDAENTELVRAATEENVRKTVNDIVSESTVIAELIESGDLAVVGGIYDLASGRVTWLD